VDVEDLADRLHHNAVRQLADANEYLVGDGVTECCCRADHQLSLARQALEAPIHEGAHAIRRKRRDRALEANPVVERVRLLGELAEERTDMEWVSVRCLAEEVGDLE
jgi:hypothetical protein